MQEGGEPVHDPSAMPGKSQQHSDTSFLQNALSDQSEGMAASIPKPSPSILKGYMLLFVQESRVLI